MTAGAIPESKRIDGKKIAADLRARIAEKVTALQKDHNITPGLAVVLVGDDAASQIYVKNKIRATQEVGMVSFEHVLPADTSQDALLDCVRQLNDDKKVHGILVQFPVPPQIDAQTIMQTIAPQKDVDGLHPLNIGRLASGRAALTPCTPLGCVMLAKAALGADLAGKHAAIIGRSNLVGRPLAQLLLQENCTVTLLHARSENPAALCRRADIIFAAVGRPALVTGDWVKDGACIIDVGINRIDDIDAPAAPDSNGDSNGKTKLVGDVDVASVINTAAHITPVPGGVGPMTIACLLQNTLTATYQQAGLDTPEI